MTFKIEEHEFVAHGISKIIPGYSEIMHWVKF
jgi:hypothetical protein